MNPAAPAIYSRCPQPQRLRWIGRITALAVAAACLTVLVVAARVQPDPSGFGTHQQLGLAPCDFQRRTGVPCPTCGMTTSVACLVRGQILASLYVQPMGTVVGLLSATAFWVGLYASLSGKAIHRLLSILPVDRCLWLLLAMTIMAWGWKIAIHLTGHDGWRK